MQNAKLGMTLNLAFRIYNLAFRIYNLAFSQLFLITTCLQDM